LLPQSVLENAEGEKSFCLLIQNLKSKIQQKGFMTNFMQDLRYSFRLLLKNPGFTLVAVLTLALGIGANTAIFSVVNSLLLRPLPYKDAQQLVWIWGTNPKNDIAQEVASAPDYADWKSQNQSFEEMGAFSRTALILNADNEPERLIGGAVTDGFFSVLGVQPKMGRVFLPEEDKPGANRVVILSEGLWQKRFGADPNIIDKSITLTGNSYTVVGVMPADFLNPRPGDRQPAEFWVPLRLNYATAGRRGDFLGVIARLKSNVTLAQAKADMQNIASNLETQYPATNDGWGTKVLTLHERFVGDVSRPLLVLMGAVCFLLLIACANVANLLLVRASTRRKEIAIRAALGASRLRLTRQLLTESVALSLIGGALGLLIAVWGLNLLVAFIPDNLPRLNEIALDNRALAFTFTIAVITGIVFGLIPALQASTPNLNDCLKEGGKDTANLGGSNRMRNVFAVVEVAMALVLLAGAGLMTKSFLKLQDVNPGFDTRQVVTMQVQLPSTRYKEDEQLVNYGVQLLEKISTTPGIAAASLVSDVPLTGGGDFLAFGIEGITRSPSDPIQDAETHGVSPDYFKALGIQLKRGALFTVQDTLNSPGVVVISETMAKRYWGDEDPIGKRITLNGGDDPTWMKIIGIVSDVRHSQLDKEPYPQMYAPIAQQPRRTLTILARSSADTAGIIPAIRNQVKELDSNVPVFNVQTMEQILADSIAQPRFIAILIVLFACLALILAAVGIYGVISYGVTQRRHEIGIRMALGARPSEILQMIVGQGLKLVLVGIGLGLVAVFLLTRLMLTLLFEVSATDPLTFLIVSLILIAVALLACFVPARRAAQTDPMVALRYE
jgi:putative ABC transport system permease protein